MEGTSAWKGWIGYGSGPRGKDHLPPDARAEVERREAARKERQGRLLCAVYVQVYEHDAVPQVSFPAGSVLDVESDSGDIASAVARARDALAEWR
ncbi:MAG TPA: hypothetical protein VF933_23955 [Streptosporangiaceae bacterium]